MTGYQPYLKTAELETETETTTTCGDILSNLATDSSGVTTATFGDASAMPAVEIDDTHGSASADQDEVITDDDDDEDKEVRSHAKFLKKKVKSGRRDSQASSSATPSKSQKAISDRDRSSRAGNVASGSSKRMSTPRTPRRALRDRNIMSPGSPVVYAMSDDPITVEHLKQSPGSAASALAVVSEERVLVEELQEQQRVIESGCRCNDEK